MASRTSVHWGLFVWDAEKEQTNLIRHGVGFKTAAGAFLDPGRVILEDEKHSGMETRRYCIGATREGIVTVRYTHRGDQIRIIGAGYWRKWRRLYETKNSKP